MTSDKHALFTQRLFLQRSREDWQRASSQGSIIITWSSISVKSTCMWWLQCFKYARCCKEATNSQTFDPAAQKIYSVITDLRWTLRINVNFYVSYQMWNMCTIFSFVSELWCWKLASGFAENYNVTVRLNFDLLHTKCHYFNILSY